MRRHGGALLWSAALLAVLAAGRASAQPSPVDLTALATGFPGQVALDWTAPTDPNTINGYNIYWGPSGTAAPTIPGSVAQASSSSPNYTTDLPQADDDLPFAYWVTTLDSSGESQPAGPVFAAAAAPSTPAAPTLTAGALPFGQGITLTVALTGTPAVALGLVEVFDTIDSVGNTLTTLDPADPAYASDPTALYLSLPANALPCGVGVTLSAQAIDAAGDTGTPSAGLWLQEPCSPAIQVQSLSSGALTLAWTTPTGGTGDTYDVFSATGPGWTAGPLTTSVATGVSALDYSAPATPGQSQWFWVDAVDPSGVISSASNEVGLLGPPSPLSAIPSAGEVTLSWVPPPASASANENLGDYVVYYSSAPGFVMGVSPGASSLTVAASQSLTIVAGLQNFASYVFAVASEGGLGTQVSGTASAPLSATTGLPGPQISSVATSPPLGSTVVFQPVSPSTSGPVSTLLAQWTNGAYSPLASTVYTLYEATDLTATPQTFDGITPVASAPGAATSITIAAGTVPGPAWYFISVSDSSATDGVGPTGDGGADTNDANTEASAFFAPNLAPTALTMLAPTADGRVELQWPQVPFADTYTVYRATQEITTIGASGLTYSALATSVTPATFLSLGGVPALLTYTTQLLSFIDTAPVENSRSAYEVVPSMQVAGGGAVFGPASNAVTSTAYVLPEDPGQWESAGFGNAAGASGFYVTATALPDGHGVFLEWAPSGDGSYPISYYSVYRGFSPSSLTLLAETPGYAYVSTPASVTVNGSTFVPPMPYYVDHSPPTPLSDLYYGVSATSTSGYSSPDMVTTTVGPAQPLPAPILVNDYYSSGSKQVTLTWSPGTQTAGTFAFDYWQVQSVAAQGGSATALVDVSPPGSTSLLIVAPGSSLTTSAETTVSDPNPAPGTPLYLISAVDVAGNTGTPLAVSVTVPSPFTGQLPLAVQGLTASAAVTLTANALNYVLGETLTWTPNPATDAVNAYGIYRNDANGITLTAVVAYPPYTDAAGTSDTAGAPLSYKVLAQNSRGQGPASAALPLTLSPPAPSWVSFTADIPSGVGQSPAVGLVWQDALELESPLTFGAGAYTGSYNVYRSDNPSTPLPNCAGVTLPTCADLSPLTNASYWVGSVATNCVTCTAVPSANTSRALSVTLTSAPAAPAAVYAASLASGVSLTWTASSGAYEYWIYRSNAALSASPPYADFLARVTGTAFMDTGTLTTAALSPTTQTQPYYAVAAASPFQVGSALPVTAALSPPSSLGAVAGSVGAAPGSVSATVTLTWEASLSGSLVTGYNIWRATEGPEGGPSGNTPVASAAAVSGTNTYTDVLPISGGLTNTVLSYTVMAQGVSVSACSAPVTVTAYDLPHAPYGVLGNGLATGVALTWKPAPPSQGVTGYLVTWNVLDGGGNGVSPVAASPQQWDLNGLVPGQALMASVQALNSAGASSPATSTPLVLTVDTDGPAAAVIAFTAQSGLAPAVPGQTGIFLNISAPASDSGGTLVIYRSPALGAFLPPSPTNTAPLRLSDAAGGGDSPYYLTTVSGSVASLTDTALSPLYSYSYAVTAVNANGVPGGESVAIASTPAALVAFNSWAAPAVSATAGNARVDLTWTPPPPSGAGTYPLAGYRLYRKTNPGQVDTPIAPVTVTASTPPDPGFPLTFSLTQTAYTDTQVSNGLNYSYDMTSVDSAGNESIVPALPVYPLYQGSPSGLVPSPPLPPPTDLTAIVGGAPNASNPLAGIVRLQWVSTESDTVAGATYNIYRRDEFSPTSGTTTYGPPLPDANGIQQATLSDYQGVTLDGNVFVDGTPGEPDPPMNKVPVCYAISVVDAAGEGPKSQDLCVTPYNPLVPTTASWTADIIDSTEVQLTWPDMPVAGNSTEGGYGVLGYNVERSSNDGSTYTLLAFVPEPGTVTASTTSTYLDTNLSNGVAVKGVSYYYEIIPVDTEKNPGQPYVVETVDIPSGDNSIYVYRNSFDPARGGTVPIQCGLQQTGMYWIKIFTLNGEYVTTVIPPTYSNGQPSDPYLSPQVAWDGKNSKGQIVASGVYLIHLEGPGYHADARVAVIK